ncbi:hypothetical protein L1987_32271 [Smallanthus sonchifolius]|uniref:Uncharacterized protein n=1 Tax=Smallanthus sonchifolius TaxID=185202 RepID=A0ACB9I9E5_9ASTR|nr:hypothetical protein L1987_32271 [Smallanthus sonchifolius]
MAVDLTAKLEERRYIEEYGQDNDHNPVFLELAKLEYNQVQSLHQMELAEIKRWWRHLGLASKLHFARDRPLKCFLWTVELLPVPKYSMARIELAKTISILYYSPTQLKVQAFMVEEEWVRRGNEPNLKDYIENGSTTAGTYMSLVHLFFLIGEGVTTENMQYLLHSYPCFFSNDGKILRLWDDLGTSKEEQERGDIASSIQLTMRENNITSEEDGRKHILQLIETSWKELNEALVAPNIFPASIVTVALNMSRASQVVYQHDDENSYFSNVDDKAGSIFFKPIDM